MSQSSHYKIVALQNSSEKSAKDAAQKYGLSDDVACYGTIDELVADPNVEMVIVSVKVPEHAGLVEPALKAKKNVFVEWPLARNLAEAERLTTLAAKSGVKNMVGLQARQNPAVRKAKAMIAEGKLGKILGTTMNATGMIFGPTVPKDLLYALPIEHGANLLTIPAGHAIDALCYVLGEFKNLQATLANNRPSLQLVDGDGKPTEEVKKTAHDYLAVTGTLQNGGGIANIVYQGGMSKTGKNFYWEINGTKGSIVMEGDLGHVQMVHPTFYFVGDEEGATLQQVEIEPAKDYSFNVGKAYDAFVGVGDGHLTTFEDALLRHRMIDAIYRSNEKGTRESYL